MSLTSGYIRVSTARVVLEYDLVFDCKAEIISGNGISSVTPSTNQEVVEGESCTFTATLESSEWVFVGWYSSSDFSGSPESTSLSYTKTITEDTTLYPKTIYIYMVIQTGSHMYYQVHLLLKIHRLH